jgi:hypothetical protein
MTQDVGRLHKERQAIEQQIADLFAFYSKQKQSSSVRPQFFFTGARLVIEWAFFCSNRPCDDAVHHNPWLNASRMSCKSRFPAGVGPRSVDRCQIH